MIFWEWIEERFGKKNEFKNPSDNLKEQLFAEIQEAKRDLRVAQQEFDDAEESFIDVAVKRLDYATYKLNTLLTEYKNL